MAQSSSKQIIAVILHHIRCGNSMQTPYDAQVRETGRSVRRLNVRDLPLMYCSHNLQQESLEPMWLSRIWICVVLHHMSIW